MTPRTRFADLEPERRESILAAAALEFAERGYEAASVNRIIDEAGISKGTLYYYFEDKDDLFATALEHAAGRLLEEAGLPRPEDLDAEGFWEVFRTVTERTMEHMRSNDWYVRLARSFHRFRTDHGTSPAARRVLDNTRRSFEALIRRGQELGVVRDDLPLPLLAEMTRAVDDAGGRWLLDHWEEFTREERNRLADAQMDVIRDMLDEAHQGWDR